MDGGNTVFTLHMAIGMPEPRAPFSNRAILASHEDSEDEGYIVADLDMVDELLNRGLDAGRDVC